MSTALDNIRFLADSRHRLVAMEALTNGPCSRADIRSETGASAATVGRLLSDFERREWVTDEGNRYVLTPLGRFVSREFITLHTRMTVARDLGTLLTSFPVETVGFDLECLDGASVARPTPDNPLAMASRVREYELESEHSVSLTDFFPEPCLDARHEAVVNGTQRYEVVFTPSVLEAVMASRSPEKFVEMVAADRCSVFVYDGDIAPPVCLNDGLACLIVRDKKNHTIAIIETDDERVIRWIQEQFEAHRADATPVTTADLATLRTESSSP
jgi:predicted transcriptional regulator